MIGASWVGGAYRYCLTRDGDTEKVWGLTLLRARYFDDAAAAKAVAEQEGGAGDGAD